MNVPFPELVVIVKEMYQEGCLYESYNAECCIYFHLLNTTEVK